MLDGAKQDDQSITADWNPTQITLIDGVRVNEVRNVPKVNGWLTEIFRRDWQLDDGIVDQVFQVVLVPEGISAWHTHRNTQDRLFSTSGLVRIVLFDARPESPTHQKLNVLRFGELRPALVTIPPNVWHGVKNIGTANATILNMVDRAYRYEQPDHWRLPQDTDQIPYTW